MGIEKTPSKEIDKSIRNFNKRGSSECSFSITETKKEVSSFRTESIAKTFARQITTYAVAKVLYNKFQDNKWARNCVSVMAVGKWIWDVYKLACSNIPSEYEMASNILEVGKILGCPDDGEINVFKTYVSTRNLIAIASSCNVYDVKSSRDKKHKVALIDSFEGVVAAVLYEDESTKSSSDACHVNVIAYPDKDRGSAYWNNAINSFILRNEGAGMYGVEMINGTVYFTPEEWAKNQQRPHPLLIETQIKSEVSNAHESGIRRGIIVTGPQGTGKTSSVLNALAGIPGIYVIRVRDMNYLDLIFMSFSGLGGKPAVVLIDDVDRLTGSKDAAALMRALDGSSSSSPVITIMTANDPAGKLPAVIYNRRRRVDKILISTNPVKDELPNIVDNACRACDCPTFEIGDVFKQYVIENEMNHADIASAIETAKYIDRIQVINETIIIEYLKEQKEAVAKARSVSSNYRKSEEVDVDEDPQYVKRSFFVK
jgi:hypothetical protein